MNSLNSLNDSLAFNTIPNFDEPNNKFHIDTYTYMYTMSVWRYSEKRLADYEIEVSNTMNIRSFIAFIL